MIAAYYNEVATTPGQFPRMLQSAIQTAITRKGVAVVAYRETWPKHLQFLSNLR